MWCFKKIILTTVLLEKLVDSRSVEKYSALVEVRSKEGLSQDGGRGHLERGV